MKQQVKDECMIEQITLKQISEVFNKTRVCDQIVSVQPMSSFEYVKSQLHTLLASECLKRHDINAPTAMVMSMSMSIGGYFDTLRKTNLKEKMMTIEEIRQHLENAKESGYRYLFIMSDTWDYEYYPVGKKTLEEAKEYKSQEFDHFTSIAEIYDLEMDWDEQLNTRYWRAI